MRCNVDVNAGADPEGGTGGTCPPPPMEKISGHTTVAGMNAEMSFLEVGGGGLHGALEKVQHK